MLNNAVLCKTASVPDYAIVSSNIPSPSYVRFPRLLPWLNSQEVMLDQARIGTPGKSRFGCVDKSYRPGRRMS